MSSPTVQPGPHRRAFRLLEVVGAGAFGVVYLAEQASGASFRRKVALKVLHNGRDARGEASRRMRDEARVLGLLNHPNIITVFDLVGFDEQWAVVMEYIDGADLDRLVRALGVADAPMPISAALEIAAAVAEALRAAFDSLDSEGKPLGVVHRDIKPSNLLIGRAGEVKVLDFGVARMNIDTREAATGALVGTERYMAPERVLRDGDTTAGDIYALCATVFEMLAKEPLGATPILPDRHAAFVDARLSTLRARLPERAESRMLLEILRNGLSADPEARGSASVLRDEFDGLARAFGGESLRTFARRFVPKVRELLGLMSQPARGTLTESAQSESEHPEYDTRVAMAVTAPPAPNRAERRASAPEQPTGPAVSNGASSIEVGREVVAALTRVIGPRAAARLEAELAHHETTLADVPHEELRAIAFSLAIDASADSDLVDDLAVDLDRILGPKRVELPNLRRVVQLLAQHRGDKAAAEMRAEIERIGRTPSTLTAGDARRVILAMSSWIADPRERCAFIAAARRLVGR